MNTSRRDFLKSLGLGFAALILTPTCQECGQKYLLASPTPELCQSCHDKRPKIFPVKWPIITKTYVLGFTISQEMIADDFYQESIRTLLYKNGWQYEWDRQLYTIVK